MLSGAVGSFRVLSAAFGCCRQLSGAFGSFRMLAGAFGCFRVRSAAFDCFGQLSGAFGSLRATGPCAGRRIEPYWAAGKGGARERPCPAGLRRTRVAPPLSPGKACGAPVSGDKRMGVNVPLFRRGARVIAAVPSESGYHRECCCGPPEPTRLSPPAWAHPPGPRAGTSPLAALLLLPQRLPGCRQRQGLL